MPGKNTIKTYVVDGYYHLYNRGIDRREIFLEKRDCAMFLYFIKIYLSPPEVLEKLPDMTPRMLFKIRNLNLYNEIDLLSFTPMPNHFHFQVKQHTEDAIQKFMRRVFTSYSQYFNFKYRRKGPLFESVYKAVNVLTDEQNLYLSSYIHRNSLKLKNPKFDFVQFSSYPYYLGDKHAVWMKSEEILSFFKRSKSIGNNDALSYQNFVENFKENPQELLGDLIIEEN
jgi:putative transposase